MSVGANIKKRRFEMRMTQQELAEAMGYKTRSTIAKIEAEENDVSQRKLKRFAEVLDTTVEQLISGQAPTIPSDPVLPAGESRPHRNVLVLLAGGKTGRNRQNIPSQFITVRGKPILVYCLEPYQAHPSVDDIYVVCLRGWENIVKAYARQYGISKLRGVIPGGSSGMLSLKNALDALSPRYDPRDLMIIQESTRPLITTETISRLLLACAEKDSATICHSMNEYVQFSLASPKAKYIDRSTTIALQSPEAHRFSVLRDVFSAAVRQQHPLTETCCTMLLYNLGYPINFIESNVNNIKIVREEDIAAFSSLVK